MYLAIAQAIASFLFLNRPGENNRRDAGHFFLPEQRGLQEDFATP